MDDDRKVGLPETRNRTPDEEVPAAGRAPDKNTLPDRGRLWSQIRTSPQHAPELLALAAVRELGPAATGWASEIRGTYPAASADGLARLAIQQGNRFAAAAGLAGAGTGPAGGLVELAAVAFAQAGLVLRLAAAYGQDPTDPERAVDLLVLNKVHPTEEAARDALAAATGGDTADRAGRLVSVLSTRAGNWGARRLVAKLLPGAGVLLALASSTTGMQRLAARATTRYRTAAAADR